MERKDVYNFAVKWNEKFRDSDIDYIELVDHYLADDCSALGFEMDCGHAFEEKFEIDSWIPVIESVIDWEKFETH